MGPTNLFRWFIQVLKLGLRSVRNVRKRAMGIGLERSSGTKFDKMTIARLVSTEHN
jgi:hypothetical protein